MLHMQRSQMNHRGANRTETAPGICTLVFQEAPMNAYLCIITRIALTIGAERGRAARGAPLGV